MVIQEVCMLHAFWYQDLTLHIVKRRILIQSDTIANSILHNDTITYSG